MIIVVFYITEKCLIAKSIREEYIYYNQSVHLEKEH